MSFHIEYPSLGLYVGSVAEWAFRTNVGHFDEPELGPMALRIG
jgi:hypothetical protein